MKNCCLLSLLICLTFSVAVIAVEPSQDVLPPAPEGRVWKLIWHDEFDGTRLDESKWDVPPDAPRRERVHRLVLRRGRRLLRERLHQHPQPRARGEDPREEEAPGPEGSARSRPRR